MTFALAPLDRLKSRLITRFGRFRYGLAALDQIALSVFAFALNLCLIRALSATDFGIVSLWMAMAALSTSAQAALVSGPLNIHLPAALDATRARSLEAAVGVVNLLAVGFATGAVVLVNACSNAEWAPQDTATALAIPVFIAAGMYREFYRTVAFSRSNMAMLLWIDAPYLAVTSLAVGAMLAWPEWCASLAVAFLAMSVGCIVSQLCLRMRFRFPKLWPLQRGWLAEYRRIGSDVGWALVGVGASHLQARSYIYVTVSLVSLAGLASISVVGILFRPVRLLLHAWMRSVLPNMSAQLASARVGAFDRLFMQGFVAAAGGSALWFFLLWLAWQPIERYFLAGHYPDAWSLMLPWAIAAGLNVMAFTVSVALQAAREFKFLAYATMLNAPLTLAATAAAVLWQGYTWTMYGVALGDLIALSMYIGRLCMIRRKLLVQAGSTREDVIVGAAPGVSQS